MKPANTLKRCLSVAAIFAGATLSGPSIAVPVLVGNATLNIANDLTVIQDGGQTLQFLDLTVTQGSTVANALANFGASGFTWATGAEVAQLFEAFGFSYANAPGQPTPLNISAANATNFSAYLGYTFADASLGWIDDLTNPPGFGFDLHTYACISVLACQPSPFVRNTSVGWPAGLEVGVFLVRQAPLAIPEPGGIALLAVGLIALASSSRRKNQRASPRVSIQ